MPYKYFISIVHKSTKRDYLDYLIMSNHDKIEMPLVAEGSRKLAMLIQLIAEEYGSQDSSMRRFGITTEKAVEKAITLLNYNK